MFWKKIALLSLAVGCFFFGQPTLARADCGCDKPPPPPAAVIPKVAFPGMTVTLFDNSLQVGQTWDVVFQGGTTTATVGASVVSKRDITDATGMTSKPQLVVPVPSISAGPTSILAYTATASLFVPNTSFTVIGKPVVYSEQNGSYKVSSYTTAVGYDGATYISIGVDKVCKAMKFRAFIKEGYPLRIDNLVISNHQGFLINSLGTAGTDYFSIEPKNGTSLSDTLNYYRHSFEQYCADHQSGGAKGVDPADPNWHLDGTPHVDYSTLIFAIAGHFDNGSVPTAGSVSFDLMTVETDAGNGTAPWEHEKPEENMKK